MNGASVPGTWISDQYLRGMSASDCTSARSSAAGCTEAAAAEAGGAGCSSSAMGCVSGGAAKRVPGWLTGGRRGPQGNGPTRAAVPWPRKGKKTALPGCLGKPVPPPAAALVLACPERAGPPANTSSKHEDPPPLGNLKSGGRVNKRGTLRIAPSRSQQTPPLPRPRPTGTPTADCPRAATAASSAAASPRVAGRMEAMRGILRPVPPADGSDPETLGPETAALALCGRADSNVKEGTAMKGRSRV